MVTEVPDAAGDEDVVGEGVPYPNEHAVKVMTTSKTETISKKSKNLCKVVFILSPFKNEIPRDHQCLSQGTSSF